MAAPAAAIAAVVPCGEVEHQYVAVLVNAGDSAVTEHVDGDALVRAQDPKNSQSLVLTLDGEHVALVPHSYHAVPFTVIVAAGRVIVLVPRAPVVGVSVIVPDVALFMTTVPATEPDVPSVMVPLLVTLPVEASTDHLFVFTDMLPVTSKVPATVVLPFDAVMLNLFVLIATFPLTPRVPVIVVFPAASVEDNVVAPVTARVEANEAAPVTFNVESAINAPTM